MPKYDFLKILQAKLCAEGFLHELGQLAQTAMQHPQVDGHARVSRLCRK
jgi:hypothetical protein